MHKNYERLLKPLTFNNGSSIDSRFVMSPMVAEGSTKDGHVQDGDIKYFSRRSKSASMLITGATCVSPNQNAFGFGLGNIDESYQIGLTKLATTMKQDGALAINQLFHPGRQAKYSYLDTGIAYGPSKIDFPVHDYPITELTDSQINQIIVDFAEATKRSIKAGFDGVEIHGANHYLIQQFFSADSNKRRDKWGGSIENRSRFAFEIIKAIKEVIKKYAKRPVILGYRISPEELHGDTVGYTLDESSDLIDKIASMGIDYIHVSLTGPNAYKSKIMKGKYQGQITNSVIHKIINGRTAHIVVGDIVTADQALDALNYGDLFALATTIIVNPDFKTQIKLGQSTDYSLVTAADFENLSLPTHFDLMIYALNETVPKDVISKLKTIYK